MTSTVGRPSKCELQKKEENYFSLLYPGIVCGWWLTNFIKMSRR